jgi:hypothetical protein
MLELIGRLAQFEMVPRRVLRFAFVRDADIAIVAVEESQ